MGSEQLAGLHTHSRAACGLSPLISCRSRGFLRVGKVGTTTDPEHSLRVRAYRCVIASAYGSDLQGGICAAGRQSTIFIMIAMDQDMETWTRIWRGAAAASDTGSAQEYSWDQLGALSASWSWCWSLPHLSIKSEHCGWGGPRCYTCV
jgi:hypothetical protein